ncbi:MAG: fused MFS/spermidine synthase [Ilumatobacter sp.]|nr:fused MFS/spermidine synthase [Ilumatobacter sp.]
MDPSDPPRSTALPAGLAIALVAGTSAAVLVLEILAGRLLAPYVGVSLDTYTGIIGTILAGIAVGAWIGGALADRIDPRRLLPVLLMLGGALAVATIPIVRLVGGSSGSDGGLRIIVLAAAGFLPSATVLSAVPPAVIKLQLRDLDVTGSTVGRLSAWSTGGAIVGTFGTGFVLVATAAVTTLIVSVGIVLFVAGLAMWSAGLKTARTDVNSVLNVTALMAMAFAGLAAVGAPCDTHTAYYCLSVRVDETRPSGRVLVLDDLRHSYVDLDDPTHLEFWYVRRLVDAIETAPAADDIIYLGGGGLTIPRYIRATAPATTQTVFEIDGELIEIVEDRMGFESSASIGIEIGDARLELGDVADDSADIVIGDAFGSRSVPFHLATEEYVRDIERVLRPDGVYAVNVIDKPKLKFLAAEAATLAQVFDQVVVILGPFVTVGGGGNSVIIASDGALDLDALGERRVTAIDFGELVDDLDAFIDGAPVLTDDFAPVDQLIAAG